MRLFSSFTVFLIAVLSFAKTYIPGYYDSTSQLFKPADSSYSVGWFDEGVAIVSHKGFEGLIAVNGELLIEPRFDKIFPFEGSFAKIAFKNRFGLINRQGKLLIEARMQELGELNDGMAVFRVYGNPKVGLVDSCGKEILKEEYESLMYVRTNQYAYLKDAVVGITDLKGKEKPLYKYADACIQVSTLPQSFMKFFRDFKSERNSVRRYVGMFEFEQDRSITYQKGKKWNSVWIYEQPV